MSWTVHISAKVQKQRKKLPLKVRYRLDLLIKELSIKGPYRSNWRNYSKLKNQQGCYHCHIKDGHPTYVVCWKVSDKEIQIMEVYYVGTHENAPY